MFIDFLAKVTKFADEKRVPIAVMLIVTLLVTAAVIAYFVIQKKVDLNIAAIIASAGYFFVANLLTTFSYINYLVIPVRIVLAALGVILISHDYGMMTGGFAIQFMPFTELVPIYRIFGPLPMTTPQKTVQVPTTASTVLITSSEPVSISTH